jgi:MFS transporter, MHS family, shikimate and dehydroshikimate transport protein
VDVEPASTATDRDTLWEESRRRLIPATVLGSLVEWYDIAIYGQAAALVFATLFFPDFSPTAGLVAAFATFGVGYLARPLGAVVFGHVGDRYSRRTALVLTLLLMGAATVLIGVLPPFGAVGVLAPVLLVVCRLAQGLAVGAEYVGAVTMVAEFAPARRRGYYAALPACGVFLGIGLAAAVWGTVSLLPEADLYSWGWRIPFLLSVVVVAVGLVIRLRIPESPVFSRLKVDRARATLPALATLRAVPGRLLLVMVANTPLAFNIYVFQTYSLSYLKAAGVAASTALFALLVGCAVGAVAIPLVGRWSDRVGRRPVYLAVALFGALVPFPFFWLVDTGATPAVLLAFALALGGGCLAMFGAQAAFYAELFPAAYRFSGFGLGREIPGALLAGPAPIIAVGLVDAVGGAPWLLAAALVVVALASAAALAALPETRGARLDR